MKRTERIPVIHVSPIQKTRLTLEDIPVIISRNGTPREEEKKVENPTSRR